MMASSPAAPFPADEPFLAAETSPSRSKNETSTRGSAFVATGTLPVAIPSNLPPRPVFARAPLAPGFLRSGHRLAQRRRPRGVRPGRRGSRSFLAGASRLLPVGNSLGARLLQVAAGALADAFYLFLDSLQLACEALLDLIDFGKRLLEFAREIRAHAPKVAHPSADLSSKLRQAFRPKDNHSHYQDDEHFLVTDAKHGGCILPGRNSCPEQQ